MREVPRYITALIASLQCRGARQDAIQELDDREWQELLAFCDAAHVTLFLSKLDGGVLPEWVAARVQRNVTDSSLRWKSIRGAYRQVSAALDDAGVEHLVIKGFAQCPAFVADPRLRMQGDFDIYAPPGSIERFEDALRKVGYRSEILPRRNGFLAGDHLPAMTPDTKFEWRGNCFAADMPLGVEPHLCFWNEVDTRLAVEGVGAFWERRVVRHLDDLTFTGLHPVDNLGYCALHILRNLFRCEWVIHHVYELACCLHANAGDAAFWRCWRESHDDSLRSLEAISFRLAKTWFNCDLSEEAEGEILGLSPAVQQWFECFSDSPIDCMFRANKDGVWLHIALLEKASDKRAVLHHTLFPAMLPSPRGSKQTVTKFKKTVKPWRANGLLRYPTYVISRSAHHLGVLPSAIWNGCRWWLAQKGLSSQFWTFFAASFCFNLGLSTFFFLFNIHLIDRGFTEKSIGWLVSAMAAGSIVGTLPAGLLASRYGLRRAALTCFVSAIVIFSLRAVVVAVPAQLVLAFAAGAALSIWAVCISPLVAQLTTERNRPFAFSLIFSSGIGTVALGSIAGGSLPGLLQRVAGVTNTLAQQVALLLCCGVVALGLRPIWRLRMETVAAPKKHRLPAVHPFLRRFLPAIAIWSLVTGSFMPFANVYFAKHLQMPLPQIGFVFSISQIMQVAAVLLAPLVFRRFGLVTGIIYMQVATAAALASLGLFHGLIEASFLYVGYTAFQWMSEPGMYSLLMDKLPPADRSDASAWNVLVSSCSQAVAATLAGAAFVRFDYPVVLMMVAGIALLAACSFHLLLRTSGGREVSCRALSSGMGEVRKPG
jgi:predicted MFS family arabinose efflux permease